LLETVALGLRVSIVACGNVTLKRPEFGHGLEPDECYYIQNANRVIEIRELDLRVDPPPDLVIEIESTRTIIDRLELYHAMGVPEIWCYDGERLRMLVRAESPNYSEVQASRAFPQLTAERLSASLARAGLVDDTTLCLELLDWVRQSPTA
jgi:Uma2 family endonuclease